MKTFSFRFQEQKQKKKSKVIRGDMNIFVHITKMFQHFWLVYVEDCSEKSTAIEESLIKIYYTDSRRN